MRKILLLVLIIISQFKLSAQGCSDAGACSLSFHRQQDSIEEIQKRKTIAFGNIVALGEEGVFINSNYFLLSGHLSKKIIGEIKLTGSYINGDLASVFNVGDIYLKGTYLLKSNSKVDVQILGSVKIPLNNSNFKNNGISLPMVYQTSLGTTDLITGYWLKWKNWEFFNLIQAPITQNNNNYFSPAADMIPFPSTNRFERNPDLIASLAYKKPFSKFLIGGQMLGIYHLGNDTYLNLLNERKEIIGSEGLTLNINATMAYQLNKKSNLGLSLASPMVVRKVRPDGLTRAFTFEVNYQFSF